MDFVVFDFETTGLSAEKDEIIEIGAVFYADGNILDTFHTLVRPIGPIPTFIQSLTGLCLDDFESAPPLEQVLPDFLSFIEGKTLAGHNVEFDLGFLLKACEDNGYDIPTSVDALDTLLLSRVLLPTVRNYSLTNLATFFDIEENSFHRALHDAATTAQVIQSLWEIALEYPSVTLVEVSRLAAMFSHTTASWLHAAEEERLAQCGTRLPDECDMMMQLVFHKSQEQINPEETPHQIEGDTLSEQSVHLLAGNHGLPQIMPDFEVREGQKQMVEAVAKALEAQGHLIVEAGTGTGKSLAYLIPAALYARENEERVVISTHTIALQDQIEKRDFSTIRALLGNSVSLAVLKGRTHYLCLRKLHVELSTISIGSQKDEITAFMTLVCWLVKTRTGMKEELALTGKMGEVWSRVQSDADTCTGKHGPFYKSCYYFQARSRAYDADVIVTNHSLVLSDLKSEHHVLPKYTKLVIDEAHHLEDEATKHLGKEANFSQCLTLLSRLSRDSGKHGAVPDTLRNFTNDTSIPRALFDILHKLAESISEIRTQLERTFEALGLLCGPGHGEERITEKTFATKEWAAFEKYIEDLVQTLRYITKASTNINEYGEKEDDVSKSGRLLDVGSYLNQLADQIQVLCDSVSLTDDWVIWVEKFGNGSRIQTSLHTAPIDVAHILERELFDKKDTVILTSATLSVNGRFQYAVNQLGLQSAADENRLATLHVASPFELARQALLCVPTDVPELAKLDTESAAAWLSDSLYQLAKISAGRMLVLFTSHAMLRATAERIRDPLQSLHLNLFAQGVDGNRTHLLRSFKKDPNSVLLGAQSFWEGIDLPGNELTTLVIVRLPFTPPNHPVTQARHERMQQFGKNPFMEQSLPEAVVRFRQGFGRLIRTAQDRGVVVVYDKRLITARYGRTFVQSLRDVRPYTETEAEMLFRIRNFLQLAGTVEREV